MNQFDLKNIMLDREQPDNSEQFRSEQDQKEAHTK